MSVAEGFRSAFSFLTIFPVGGGEIDEMGRYAFFFPIVGAIIGLIGGLIGLVFFAILDPYLAGWLTLFALLVTTGLNHIDGLLDLGDGLMVRGQKEKKLEVLHDKHHGVGGYFFLFSVLVLTASLISQLQHSVLVSLIIAECCGKLSMVLVAGIGKPHTSGIGSVFISHLKRHLLMNSVVGITFCTIITLILASTAALPILATVFIFSILWTLSLQKSFGCITGDMLGSAGEMTRMIVLFVFYILARVGM